MKNKLFVLWIVAIFMCEFAVFAFTRFTLWPEMVLYPWLHNNGFLLYKDIGNPYFPLLTWILSLITKFFGYQTHVFVAFTWGDIFLSQMVFLFVASKILIEKTKIIFSFLIYSALLVVFEGNGLWFDLICTVPLLLAFYFLINNKYFLAGMCLGVGLLIKQTVIWTILGSILFIDIKTFKRIICVLLPILILLVVTSLFFYLQGSFPDFFFWTIKLALGGMQSHPGFIELPTRRNLIIIALVFWPIILSYRYIFKKKEVFAGIIFFFSTAVFAFPRFGYFHLVASLPFFAIIAAYFLKNKIVKVAYLVILFVLLFNFVKLNSPFSVRFFSKETYQKNSALDKYFMKNKLPDKPWIDNFPWYTITFSLRKQPPCQN